MTNDQTTTAPAFAEGDRVRFTASSLGVLATPDASRFEHETVNEGDEGVYLMPHPNPQLVDWHLIRVEVAGRVLYCPAHPAHFEAA